MNPLKKGILLGIFSYVFWGFTPLFWRFLDFANPLQILGGRITFALVFCCIILFIRGNRNWHYLLLKKGKRSIVALSGILISINWGIFIWAVNSGFTIEASLGYYITPITSVILAMFFLGERLNFLQKMAFGFAVLGVILVTIFSGVFPWISLALAITFSFYGLIKKKNDAGSMEALGAETLAVLPVGLVLLFLAPGELPAPIAIDKWLLLISGGIITALPLYTFAKGVKLIPLTTLGFLQFISPTMIFFLGIFAFGEKFPMEKLWAFACIWAAVGLYCISPRIQKKAA